MQPIRRIKSIARAVINSPRHVALAGALMIGGGGATTIMGAQAASATGGGYEPTTTTQPIEECGTGFEMDPCPTTTTSTTTTEPPTTTTSTTTTEPPSTTTTTEPPTTTTTEPPTTTTTIPIPCGTCEDFNQILLSGTNPDPIENYWEAVREFTKEFNLEYKDALEFIQEECGLHPPIEPPTTTTTTTIPATTTTEPPTTTTTEPPTTTTTSTVPVTVTSAPPGLPPVVVTVPPTAPPVVRESLPRTGAETDLLTLVGTTSVVGGAGALAASARMRARNAANKLTGKEVAAGGPPEPDKDDLPPVSEPLTGEEIDAIDFDAIDPQIEALSAEPKQRYTQGNNRISEMKGYNVPDNLLPASLRINQDQKGPARPTFDGQNPLMIPGRLLDRGIEL